MVSSSKNSARFPSSPAPPEAMGDSFTACNGESAELYTLPDELGIPAASAFRTGSVRGRRLGRGRSASRRVEFVVFRSCARHPDRPFE